MNNDFFQKDNSCFEDKIADRQKEFQNVLWEAIEKIESIVDNEL